MKQLMRRYGWLPLLICVLSISGLPGAVVSAEAVLDKVVCEKSYPPPPEMSRLDVYASTPFKPGEVSVFEVSYMGIKAGYGTINVYPPRMHKGVWHRIFNAEAKTGDWFKSVYIATYKIEAISRPWDYGVSKFYIERDEGKIFSRRQLEKKWLDFDHDACKTHEKVRVPDQPDKETDNDLEHGAIDALGVVFRMRTKDFRIGKIERELVYTSEKNWWLEAKPLQFEQITVPAGTFDTVKLKLQTYIGKELQQKGDVYAWIDIKTKERPLVQLQGDIKIGSVWVKLHQFTPGT